MLTDRAIRNLKPREKSYKKADERGLYLEITAKGSKLWRFKYRFEGKEKRLSFGKYPDVGLKEARQQREGARSLLAQGINPSQERKDRKQAALLRVSNSFESVAMEWFEKQKPGWAPRHAETVISRLTRDIFPEIGDRPIAEITAPQLLAVVRKVEARGAIETAHRELGICSQVFRYAVATGRAERDPSGDLRGALQPVQEKHLAAITEPIEVGQLLRMIDGYQGSLAVQCALKLAPLVFVRPGELRQARWADVDLEAKEWRFVISKTHSDHIVPLATQAIAILREIEPLTGRGEFVFPSVRSSARPMSNNTVNAALRGLGIPKEKMTGHGFRAMARTLMDEQLKIRPDLIEQQLGHTVRDPLGRAYNRTSFIEERHQMMQQWADYLAQLKKT